MITSGTDSLIPGRAEPPDVGYHDLVDRYWISACPIPIAKPPAVAQPNDVKRPSSAAANAGTIKYVIVDGSTEPSIGAVSTANSATTMPANTQLPPLTRSGECPTSERCRSSSAAARVASPNRVNRQIAHNMIAIRITRPPRISWFTGTTIPDGSVTEVLLSVALTLIGSAPKCRTMIA